MRARERIAQEDGQEFKLTSKQIHVLKRARIVTASAMHPDTGKLISWPMRMSSFIYLQVPLTTGLTMAPPTTFNTFFWQWLNQTYYAGLNFGNRNASNLQEQVNVFLAYSVAAVTSVTIAVFLRRFLSGYALKMASGNQILFNSTTSFIALAAAGYINASVMRSSEVQHGIAIYDPKDPMNILGFSK